MSKLIENVFLMRKKTFLFQAHLKSMYVYLENHSNELNKILNIYNSSYSSIYRDFSPFSHNLEQYSQNLFGY